MIVFPEKMDSLWAQAKDVKSQDTWTQLEKKIPLMDHCLLGEIAAAFWGFPDFTVSPIRFHHNPGRRARDRDGFICHIVALANYLKHWLMLEPHFIDEDGMRQCTTFFKLSTEQLEGIAENLQAQLYLARP